MLCAKLLSWLGAEVAIAVAPQEERVKSWEPVARLPSGDAVSLRHVHYNHTKRIVSIDVGTDAGRRWLLEQVRTVDVLVEDWGPTRLEREARVTGAELLAQNPRLVLCRISPFGQSGPYAAYPASDLTIQAAGGLLALTGDPERAPLRVSEDMAWNLAGLHAAVGALVALVKADRMGTGQEVDVSAQAAVAVTLEAPYGRVIAGAPRTRMGSRHYATSPCNIYQAEDGWVGVCANQDVQIGAILDAVSLGEFHDPVPPVDALRRDQALSAALDSVLAGLISKRRVRDLVDVARDRGLLLAKVNDVPDLIDDAHLRARGAIPSLGPPYPARWRDAGSCFRWRSAGGAAPTEVERRGGLPLEGVRVLDFSWAWAGPACTKFLAAAGAEVFKIENPHKPDVLRRYPPLLGRATENEYSSFFADQNFNKKSILLDMKDPETLTLIRRMLPTAHVIVENFRPHVMASWGLSFDDVVRENPGIVYASISGYGATGPYSSRPAYGALMESEGGVAALIRYGNSGPYRTGTSLPDPVLGAAAAVAVIAGLSRSLRTGVGVHLDLSMMEATLAVLGPAVLGWTALGQARQRSGNLSVEGAPEGCYRCTGPDDWVAVSVRNEVEWKALCGVLGLSHLGSDPTYARARDRTGRAHEIDRWIEHWTRQRSKGEAAAQLRSAGVPAFAVLTLDELVEDAQLCGFGFFPTVEHREMGKVKLLGVPFRLSGEALPVRLPPPLLDEHAEEICRAVTVG